MGNAGFLDCSAEMSAVENMLMRYLIFFFPSPSFFLPPPLSFPPFYKRHGKDYFITVDGLRI